MKPLQRLRDLWDDLVNPTPVVPIKRTYTDQFKDSVVLLIAQILIFFLTRSKK